MSRSFVPKVKLQKNLPQPAAFKKLNKLSKVKKFLVIYDRKLIKNIKFKKWLDHFDFSYAVTAGEPLKDSARFGAHMNKIIALADGTSANELCIIGVGGGSVGDFAGFVASVYKRGTRLIHLPSTWLAALDSAHGGKTALNVGPYKNQMGTFYPADAVFISRDLLSSLNAKELQSAYGELIKMALISGPGFLKDLTSSSLTNEKLLWKFLPRAIKSKYKIIKKDPYETEGLRQVLNLGHTFGHVLESYYKLPHGVAVNHGLRFSLEWSYKRKYIGSKKYTQLDKTLKRPLLAKNIKSKTGPLTVAQLKRLVRQDKKSTSANKVNFVFIKGSGQASIKKVSFDELIKEAQRQGWV